MATVTLTFCDACGERLEKDDGRHGLVVNVGHSRGGWGHRRDTLSWSGVVCDGCYLELGHKFVVDWNSKFKAIHEGAKTKVTGHLPRVILKRDTPTWWERIKRALR